MSADHVEEIKRQVQEGIDGGRVLKYKNGEYSSPCSPGFIVAQPGSTALRFVVEYGELNNCTQNHPCRLRNMDHTLGRMSSCRYKTQVDKWILFWQVGLSAAAQELLACINPKGYLFSWLVMQFGVANALAVLQELMYKIL